MRLARLRPRPVRISLALAMLLLGGLLAALPRVIYSG
jgi:hypothetical protein